MARSRRTSSVAAVALAGMAGVSHEVDENVENAGSLENEVVAVASGKQDVPQGDLLDRWVASFKEDQKAAVGTIITMILQVHHIYSHTNTHDRRRESTNHSHRTTISERRSNRATCSAS